MFIEFGNIKLTRLQLFAWTWISITIYLLNFFIYFSAQNVILIPDIDSTLVILTGLSIASYLGGKMIAKAPVVIDRVIEDKGAHKLLILGRNFGYYLAPMIFIDNAEVKWRLWTNNRIVVDIDEVQIEENSVLEVLREDNICTTKKIREANISCDRAGISF